MNRTDPIKVMIVEDNPGDIFLITGLLEEMGTPMQFVLAKDGREAINILTKKGTDDLPDLVILDLNLPRVHGYDVLSLIRASPVLKDLPVIVMTGSLNPDDEVNSRRLGATDYCIKPGTKDELDRTSVCLLNQIKLVCHGRMSKTDPGSFTSALAYGRSPSYPSHLNGMSFGQGGSRDSQIRDPHTLGPRT